MKKLENLSEQIDQCLALAAGDEMIAFLLSMASLEVSRRIETRQANEKTVPFDDLELVRVASLGR